MWASAVPGCLWASAVPGCLWASAVPGWRRRPPPSKTSARRLTACGGGCLNNFPIVHPSFISGRFGFAGTEYESLNSSDGVVPPIRFWAYDDYWTANSGCADPLAVQPWLTNVDHDCRFGIRGDGVLYGGAGWAGPRIDGCFEVAANRRTFVELAWADILSGDGGRWRSRVEDDVEVTAITVVGGEESVA